MLSVKGYSTLDNAGASVMLETVRFKANSMSFVTAVPPIMPDPGMATIAALSGQPARLPESANSPVGLQRFFLMTSSKELIEKIVPRVRYEDKDTKRLIERGRDLAKAKRGIQRARGFQELRRSGGFETVKTELFAPIFVDMDGDGQPDLAIGLRSIVPERSDETAGALKLLWAAVGLIYSSGREEFFGRPIGIGRYWALQKDGWVLDAPFALVRVDECLYLVTQPYPEYGPIKLYSLPNETDSCMDIGVFKVVDMSLWH